MIPKVGEFYHFWDDGKHSLGRHYIAKVERIIPFEKAKNIWLESQEFDDTATLLEIWEDEVNDHPKLYKDETDFFIECSIPKYDKDLIYFCRTNDDGWLGLRATGWWQCGTLDVDGSIFKEVLEDSSDELKEKHKNVKY